MQQPENPVVAVLLLLGAFLVGFGCWTTLSGAPDDARLWGLVASGFLGGLAFAVLWRRDAVPSALTGYGLGVVLTAATGVFVARDLHFASALVTMLSGGCAAAAFGVAIWQIVRQGQAIAFDSTWGGLGQGMGGWRLSAPAGLLVVAVLLGAVSMGAAIASSHEPATAAVPPKPR